MFVNVTGESAESLKSKFRKVAIHLTKDKVFLSLLVMLRAAKAPWRLTITLFVYINHFLML